MIKVRKYILILFHLELCCTCCLYDNLHNSHQLIKLSEIETLNKNILIVDSTNKQFNEVIQKISKLKNKIENEINRINNLYEKAINELSLSYFKKNEKKVKEENDLKEKLEKEVTKVKRN